MSARNRKPHTADASILPGATAFSKDHEVNHHDWLIDTMLALPSIFDPLVQATTIQRPYTKARMPGMWALAYLCFVMSKMVDVQPWYSSVTRGKNPMAFWERLGFVGCPPAYGTVYARFCELEERADAFRDTAGVLIRLARSFEPRIGQNIHVDSCEAETHAKLHHDDAGCDHPDCVAAREAGQEISAPRVERMSTKETGALRQEAIKAQSPDPEERREIAWTDLEASEQQQRIGRELRRHKVNKHWYLSRDLDAGVRAYVRNGKKIKFWPGYYNQKFIDHLMGAAVYIPVESASINEHTIYMEHYPTLVEVLGAEPLNVIADRGFDIKAVRMMHTKRGVGSCVALRDHPNQPADRDTELLDRNGVPRCQGCGGETRVVNVDCTEYPVVFYECMVPVTDGCFGRKRMRCSVDWRRLGPLMETDPVYHELRESHSEYERVHGHMRRRYRIGGDNVDMRPFRLGRGCQQLRAHAAVLIEWLRIDYRQGWLPGMTPVPVEATRDRANAERWWNGMLEKRRALGLDLPYGPAAHREGLGELLPPSERDE